MVKSVKNMNPSEAMIDHIICEQKTVYEQNQRKVALLAAEIIEDQNDLVLVLDMLGLKVKNSKT